MAVGHGCVTKVKATLQIPTRLLLSLSILVKESYMGFHIKLHHSCLLWDGRRRRSDEEDRGSWPESNGFVATWARAREVFRKTNP